LRSQLFEDVFDGTRHFVLSEQVGQFGDVHGHAARLITRQPLGAALPHRLIFEINIGERLAGGVVDDERFLALRDTVRLRLRSFNRRRAPFTYDLRSVA